MNIYINIDNIRNINKNVKTTLSCCVVRLIFPPRRVNNFPCQPPEKLPLPETDKTGRRAKRGEVAHTLVVRHVSCIHVQDFQHFLNLSNDINMTNMI